MAVLKMNTFKVIGPLDKLDEAIDILCKSEMFEPEPAQNFFKNVRGLKPINEPNPYAESLRLLTETVKASNRELKRVNTEGFIMSEEQIKLFINRLNDEVGALQAERDNTLSECRELKSRIDQLGHFKKISIPLN